MSGSASSYRVGRCLQGVVIACLLAACAGPQTRTPAVDQPLAEAEARKQRELVLESWLASNQRLQAVSSQILTHGTELCGEHVGPYFGFETWTVHDFAKDWQAVARTRFQLDEDLRVAIVADGSPAASGGLQVGDVIQEINEQSFAPGKDIRDRLHDRLRQSAKSGFPVKLTVLRGTERVDVPVSPQTACDFRVELSQQDQKNAYADGQKIVVYKGMMDFFRSDEEIALVVSHELAHNAMRHVSSQKTNAIVGGLVGLLLDVAAAYGGVNTSGNFTDLGMRAGASAYSVAFEQEADYVGLYFMALSGYRIDDAANFWRRMAATDPRAITMKSTHPTTPERFVAIEQTVAEIQAKIAEGQPLKPETK